MPDQDVVDEIVSNCQSWGVYPVPFLAMLWWESKGLQRSITWTNPDGTIGRTFPGGDFAVRKDGTYGPQSFGVCQIYAVVHGPFIAPGIPDYQAAASKWDNVTTSMRYLSTEGPRGGWLAVYASLGADAAYKADPRGFMVQFSPKAQGSDPWAAWMADQAVPAAEAAYQDYLNRQAPEPQPEPVPTPTPTPTPEPVPDPNNAPDNEELARRISDVALAVEAVTAELNEVDRKFEDRFGALRQAVQNLGSSI